MVDEKTKNNYQRINRLNCTQLEHEGSTEKKLCQKLGKIKIWVQLLIVDEKTKKGSTSPINCLLELCFFIGVPLDDAHIQIRRLTINNLIKIL